MTFFSINKYNSVSALLIALLLAIIPYQFIPFGSKYQIEVLKNLKKNEDEKILYRDIDHDGDSEKIRIFPDFWGVPGIIVEDDGEILFQWNLSGKLADGVFFYTGDSDNNGMDEIYMFTFDSKAIYLSCYDPMIADTLFFSLPVSTYEKNAGRADFSIYEPVLHDMNNDGKKEFHFILYCSFTKTTRKLMYIDVNSRKVFSSPLAGTCINFYRYFFDLDGDNVDEIIGAVPAFGNCPKDYPYSDQYAWLMVYDDQLNYKFLPQKIGIYSAMVCVVPYRGLTQNYLAVYYHYTGSIDSSFIGIYDSEGKLIKRRYLSNMENRNFQFMTFPKGKFDNILFYKGNGIVEVFDSILNVSQSYGSAVCHRIGFHKHLDLDMDGDDEIIYAGNDIDELVISRYDYKEPVCISIENINKDNYISAIERNHKIEALAISLNDRYVELQYGKNKLFSLRYLVFLFIVFIIFGFVISIGHLYQYFLKRKYDDEKRMTDLQVNLVEQQMNPHFMLNVLNAVGHLFETHETNKAQYYFGKYGQLLRNALMYSEKMFISIEEELDFCKNYMELEQLRMNDAFEYEIKIDGSIPNINIPRMLVHSFVENAVKHGAFPLSGERKVQIGIYLLTENETHTITITDDGIGRKRLKTEIKQSTGKGLHIVNEMLDLYYKLEHKRIQFEMSDLYPEKEEPGTKVVIKIPQN